ncbi:MAG: hypothetical protein H8D22_03670 [Candidatus Cloacimonetes bacterium]|nr:hypothetical protein [Candidatus Cloacimonadota bacterium]
MLKKIFKIISFYDEVRWSSDSNYNLINFYKKNLDDDAKLLTHWLCYIADRQMAFERIWEVGGFVFSELADQFKKKRDLQLLNYKKPNSFIEKNGKGGYNFKSNSEVNNNQILKKSYKYKETGIVKFTPRYYPSDYFSILYTFDILKEYNFSLTKFIVEQLKKYQHTDDSIKRILFSLYLLTYFEIRQPQKSDIDNFQININKAEKRTIKVIQILNNKFEDEYQSFKKNKIFNQKRAWCSLRDFFKSPEFKVYFESSLKKESFDTKQLFTLNSLQQLEMPGDVWNNNSKFRHCILENTEYENSKKSLNIILRDYFDKNKDELNNCYPEQFDITFDFVPRMCEKNNCDICPIGLLKGKKKSNFEKTCVNDMDLYCSVALTNCNYKINCFGDKCKLTRNHYE